MIIGNLTKNPELRSTTTGVKVCDFTVAVNRRGKKDSQNSNQPEADFFRVAAWRELGENCAKYLTKGKKVCVVGPVSVRQYQDSNGQYRASLEVTATEVEFLSSKTEYDQQSGMQRVEPDDNPFAGQQEQPQQDANELPF